MHLYRADLIIMLSGLLVELDEKENLETCQVDANALVRFPESYVCHLTPHAKLLHS
jgi:hypothetical protein